MGAAHPEITTASKAVASHVALSLDPSIDCTRRRQTKPDSCWTDQSAKRCGKIWGVPRALAPRDSAAGFEERRQPVEVLFFDGTFDDTGELAARREGEAGEADDGSGDHVVGQEVGELSA